MLQDDGSPVSLLIRPGEELELAGDRGSIELETVIRWGGLMVRHDPGRIPALVFSGVALLGLGLMLGVRRRRVFVRVAPVAPAASGAPEDCVGTRHTEVTVAGLPKGTDPGLDDLVDQVLQVFDLAVDWALMTDIIPKAATGRYMGLSNVATIARVSVAPSNPKVPAITHRS